MVKLNFAHLCEHASILANGTPAIIGIFSNVKATELPASYNMMVVANFMIDDRKAHQVEISIKAPSGKEIVEPFRAPIGPTTKEKPNAGVLASLLNLKLEEKGKHIINVLVDKKMVAELFFNLEIVKNLK